MACGDVGSGASLPFTRPKAAGLCSSRQEHVAGFPLVCARGVCVWGSSFASFALTGCSVCVCVCVSLPTCCVRFLFRLLVFCARVRRFARAWAGEHRWCCYFVLGHGHATGAAYLHVFFVVHRGEREREKWWSSLHEISRTFAVAMYLHHTMLLFLFLSRATSEDQNESNDG